MKTKEKSVKLLVLIILLTILVFFTLLILINSPIGEEFLKKENTQKQDFITDPINIIPRNKNFSLTEDDMIENLGTEDFFEIDITIFQRFIKLTSVKNPCDAIIISIDDFQTYSISQGLNSQIGFRPTSHDVMHEIIEAFNITVLMVKITSFEEGAYFGNIILEKENKILNQDIRPSDAIAIAVRTNSPIYIKKEVMNELKENVC